MRGPEIIVKVGVFLPLLQHSYGPFVMNMENHIHPTNLPHLSSCAPHYCATLVAPEPLALAPERQNSRQFTTCYTFLVILGSHQRLPYITRVRYRSGCPGLSQVGLAMPDGVSHARWLGMVHHDRGCRCQRSHQKDQRMSPVPAKVRLTGWAHDPAHCWTLTCGVPHRSTTTKF